MNEITLIGRNCKESGDCLRYSTSGTAIFKNTIAVDSFSKGEKQTDFIDYVAFGKSAENAANYTRKGSLIAIHGSLHIRSFEGQDGQKKYQTEVTVNSVQFLDPPKPKGNSLGNEISFSDDIPF